MQKIKRTLFFPISYETISKDSFLDYGMWIAIEMVQRLHFAFIFILMKDISKLLVQFCSLGRFIS